MKQNPAPYRPRRPFRQVLRAPRPRWTRTCWQNTLWTGTFARLANQKLGNEGTAVWLPCWSAAMLQCLLSTVGESGRREEGGGRRGWGHEKEQPSATQPHQCSINTKTSSQIECFCRVGAQFSLSNDFLLLFYILFYLSMFNLLHYSSINVSICILFCFIPLRFTIVGPVLLK